MMKELKKGVKQMNDDNKRKVALKRKWKVVLKEMRKETKKVPVVKVKTTGGAKRGRKSLWETDPEMAAAKMLKM